jgi:hypothetical protein
MDEMYQSVQHKSIESVNPEWPASLIKQPWEQSLHREGDACPSPEPFNE